MFRLRGVNVATKTKTISVLVAPKAVVKGENLVSYQALIPIEKKLPIDVLGKNISEYLNDFKGVLNKIPVTLGEYTIDSVTVSLTISETGTISITGLGGSIGAQEGITIALKHI